MRFDIVVRARPYSRSSAARLAAGRALALAIHGADTHPAGRAGAPLVDGRALAPMVDPIYVRAARARTMLVCRVPMDDAGGFRTLTRACEGTLREDLRTMRASVRPIDLTGAHDAARARARWRGALALARVDSTL